MHVSFCRVILDNVACQRDQVCREVTTAIMLDNGLQCVIGDGTSQGAAPVGKEMRVCQMQDPHRIS